MSYSQTSIIELDQTGALNNDIVIVNDMMNGPSGKVDAEIGYVPLQTQLS